MPLVPKRSHASHQYRQYSRDLRDVSYMAEIEIEHPNVEADVQLHGTLVLSVGVFFLLVLGYLFRRQIRAVPSRLAHAISVHDTASHLSNIHLNPILYSPLDDHDHETTPVHHEEPAPPYSAPFEQRRTPRSTMPLQITVPPRPTFSPSTLQLGETGVSQVSTSSLHSDAGPSSAASSPALSLSIPSPIDIDDTSKTSVLDLASPRASRWDAFPRSYGYISTTQSANQSNNCASKISNPSDILATESPCATPPPQYTITIHSSPRSRQSEGEGSPPPDIVLSPVPWLPREYVPPPSPPHYLSVPPRKSKSRVQSNTIKFAALEKEKPLPAFPRRQNVQKSNKFIPDVESEQRHASLNDVSATKPTKPSFPLGFSVPRRSATLPIHTRSIPPPAPQPVLPIDLEAVYPTSPVAETSDHSGQSEKDTPWLWRSRPRRLSGTGEMKSDLEKRQHGEKDSSSDSDDVPLSRTLALAMRRKKDRFSPKPTSPVSQVFKKQFLGRLSALAARARSAIEHEFDSSDDEEEEEDRIREKAKRSFVGRELRAVDTFIIGDEE